MSMSISTDTAPANQTDDVYTVDPRINLDDIIAYARSESLSAHILSRAMPNVKTERTDTRLLKLRDAMINLVIDNVFVMGVALDYFADADRLRKKCEAVRTAAAELNIEAIC